MYFKENRIFEGKLLIKKQRLKKGKKARYKSRKKGKLSDTGTEKKKNGQNQKLDSKNFTRF